MTRKLMTSLLCAAIASIPVTAVAGGSSSFLPAYMQTQNPMIESETWNDWLREEMVGQTTLLDGEDLMSLDAPVQAFDAATVPFTLRQRAGTERITHLKMVVDENPMPLVADFTFGPQMGEISFESRVRYDVYSNIRAIARLEDGRTMMVGRFVQAAGGCSAAVTRDVAAVEATMGEIRLKQIDTSGGTSTAGDGKPREVQLMIRHPNFTGMQVHTGTLDHIEARFINLVEVTLDDEILFKMEGGFSISENPSFRFSYLDNGSSEMMVRAVDTDGTEFVQRFALQSGT